MNDSQHLDELLASRSDKTRRTVEPCTVVIFGASGDLTARKLVPALYHLALEKLMPQPFRIIGFARREKTDESFRTELREALDKFSRTKPVNDAVWTSFAANIFYCMGDMADPAAYTKLKDLISTASDEKLKKNLLFYLATSPSQFGEVVENLSNVKLLSKGETQCTSERIVVEKPFGHDTASAEALNAELTRYVHEQQIFRIDHYLGKETVQNILTFRFSNGIFERLWNREAISHVQITVAEKLGVGSRGGYYEEAGAMRDMMQNHVLQVLSLVGMEPPVSLEAENVRDEKVKLLKSIRPMTPAQVAQNVVRGQYFAGEVDGELRPAYRSEVKVKPNSNVETFVAMRLFIDNWRWHGVPFYLRTGKNLPLSASEVRIQFKPAPNILFAAREDVQLDANSLTLRLQPNEGMTLRFNGKVPGGGMELRPVRMQFGYDTEFGAYTPEAYERLLLEAMAGDATLFIRRDEVETAWGIVDAIRNAWIGKSLTNREFYAAGTWGPTASDDMVSRDGHEWRNPSATK
ncbi:MAG TPA: glucose-6-phosphate dehydrogenase [Candidatus Limnocylindria bacterium]|jgi:glucose-6-phosphate 1-dehydrogenase|nr:glucose-6-phosphate dehydrogenase [Candidatus Limnocylindria bacterium]